MSLFPLSIVTDLVLIIIGIGIALIVAARIARRRGEELKRAGVRPWDRDFSGSFTQWTDLTVFGPLPRAIEGLGRFLAIGVIVFVVVAVVGVVAVIVYVRFLQ